MSTGYANRVINLQFPELAEPKTDENGKVVLHPESGKPEPSEAIWVVIRNPQLMPPGELTPRDVAVDPNSGRPLDAEDANQAMYEIFAKLIVGWRVYDATSFEINSETGEPLDQPLLELPATPASVAKLPNAIINKLAAQLQESANPQ